MPHRFRILSRRIESHCTRVVLAAVAVLTLASCKPRTEAEKLQRLNRGLGQQAEYTHDALIVRWPAIPKTGQPAVTFRIPRAFFHGDPLSPDEQGGFKAVYIRVSLPEMTPWIPFERPPVNDQSNKPAMRKIWKSRSVIAIFRDKGETHESREFDRQWFTEKAGYFPDGRFSGLDRRSRRICLDFRSGPEVQEFVRNKPPDDPSPPDCRMNRLSALLITPPEIRDTAHGVTIMCSAGWCKAEFGTGYRAGSIQMDVDDVHNWRDYVEPAREFVQSLVVPQQ